MAASIMVATPAYNGQVCAVYTNCLLKLFAACMQRGIGFSFAHTTSQSLIPIARNDLADYFLRSSDSHLLFIDGDMGFDADQVLRMLEVDVEVIGAVCPQKKINWQAIKQAVLANPHMEAQHLAQVGATYKTFQPLNDKPIGLDAPLAVEHIGTGIMFIKRSAFERMQGQVPHIDGQHQYFEAKVHDDGRFLSEDVHFCKMFRQAGGAVYAAPWLEVSHLGMYEHTGSLSRLVDYGVGLS